MTENKLRIGNFTSSEIYKLLEFKKNGEWDKTTIDYIENKKREAKLGRSLKPEAYANALAWGKFIEIYLADKKGWEFNRVSNETLPHPTLKGWAGSPDYIFENSNGEQKSYYPEKFAKYYDVLEKQDVKHFKLNAREEYWQLVSNNIITGKKYAKAILYMPFQADLDKIRDFAYNYEGDDKFQYQFITLKEDKELPYLPFDSYYQDYIEFEFEVPAEDKEFLTTNVKKALEILLKDY